MASYEALDASFNGLLEQLTDGSNPLFSAVVSASWLGALGQAGALARDRTTWDALPAEIPDADPVVKALDAAAAALSASLTADDSARLAALVAATAALRNVHDILHPRSQPG